MAEIRTGPERDTPLRIPTVGQELRREIERLGLEGTPTHATTHENGGRDELDVTGLSGLLADAQTPLAHTQAATTVTVVSDDWVGALNGAGTAEVQATLDWVDANLNVVPTEIANAVLVTDSTGAMAWLDASAAANGDVLSKRDSNDPQFEFAAPGGGVSDGDKGDITVTSSGSVWTIDNATVTPAKLNLNGNVEFQQNQALQFAIENRTSDPGSPVEGQIWLRTDL